MQRYITHSPSKVTITIPQTYTILPNAHTHTHHNHCSFQLVLFPFALEQKTKMKTLISSCCKLAPITSRRVGFSNAARNITEGREEGGERERGRGREREREGGRKIDRLERERERARWTDQGGTY